MSNAQTEDLQLKESSYVVRIIEAPQTLSANVA